MLSTQSVAVLEHSIWSLHLKGEADASLDEIPEALRTLRPICSLQIYRVLTVYNIKYSLLAETHPNGKSYQKQDTFYGPSTATHTASSIRSP